MHQLNWTAVPSRSHCLLQLLLCIALSHDSSFTNGFSMRGIYTPQNRYSPSNIFYKSKTALASTQTLASSSIARIRAAVYQPPVPDLSEDVTAVSLNPLEILTQVADALRMASKCGIDIVVFPEMFLNGGPNRILSGTTDPLDRESYELNVVGNLCADLNVACVTGYAESKHESELKSGEEDNGRMFNSIAAFHADGSRAGNYRCVNTYKTTNALQSGSEFFSKGLPWLEIIPTLIKLPIREEQETKSRVLKVGMMCGDDLLMPEHSRHLGHSGADILLVSASFQNKRGITIAEHMVPSRSMENEVPLLFANYVEPSSIEYVGEDEDVEMNKLDGFIGLSAIISQDGSELIRAPIDEFGDLSSDNGYLLPCEVGALYAADIVFDNDSFGSAIQNSMEQWDLNPRIELEESNDINSGKLKKKYKNISGFGRDAQKVVGRKKSGKSKK